MGIVRLLLAASTLTLACAPSAPPPIADSDAAPPPKHPPDGAPTPPPDPCATPNPGCPCDDAGTQYYCGKVYRTSGTLVECSDGYLTCQPDGGWGDCVGDGIWDAG